MSNVVEFPRKDPHIASEARDLACEHEWMAVLPVPLQRAGALECPKCHSFRGVLKMHIAVKTEMWTCMNCEANFFSIFKRDDRSHLICAGCGNVSNAIDVFPK